VLPIGGLKEKALAAQDAGIRRVIAPKLNEQDVDDIPEHLRKDIEFIFVERIEDVLREAFVPEGAEPDGRRPARRRAVTAGSPDRRKAPTRGRAKAGTRARTRQS
jgi:ATP-dependent Lon protease